MIISCKDLTVKMKQATILDQVNLSVEAGAYLGIVGPNGSGKTTLVKTILGLLPRTTGSIRIAGQDLESFSSWQKIGYLPQRLHLAKQGFPAKVKEIVASGLLARTMFPKRVTIKDRKIVADVLELLRIADLENKLIGQLSGGQIQRVLLARALVNQPEILILDEPTVALDPATRDHFYRVVKQLNQEKKTTIVLITHDSHTIGEFATTFLYLDRKVIFSGAFHDFCKSEAMTKYFGTFAQHQICHQHQEGENS
jgi:zinc transport system ATP-binding protein